MKSFKVQALMGRNLRPLAITEFKNLQNTLESVSGHSEGIFRECCEMASSWERITGKCYSRNFSIPPHHCPPWATTELSRWGGWEKGRKGERKRQREGPVALTGYYKGSSRRKRMYMVLQGVMYIIKRKHGVIKLF